MQERGEPGKNALSVPRKTTELTIRVEQGATIPDIVNGVPGAARLIGNLDMSSGRGRAMFMHSAGSDDIELDKLKDGVIELCYWICEKAEVRDDKSGSLVSVPRICFYSEAGEMISFTSWSIARFLDKLRMVIGEGPYFPPLKVHIRRIDAGGGKQQYDCNLV